MRAIVNQIMVIFDAFVFDVDTELPPLTFSSENAQALTKGHLCYAFSLICFA